MRSLGLFLILAMLMAACDETRPKLQRGGNAMQIELEGVIARQYRAGKRRFEVRAKRLVLDERRTVLEATGGVEGMLEPNLFPERDQ